MVLKTRGKIYTGSFASIDIIKKIGIVPIAISTGIPEFYKGGLRYKELQPPVELTRQLRSLQKTFKITEEDVRDYSHDYIKYVLANLNPDTTYNNLVKLAHGKNFALLSPEHSNEFSHRMIVRTWFERFGYECEEIIKK